MFIIFNDYSNKEFCGVEAPENLNDSSFLGSNFVFKVSKTMEENTGSVGTPEQEQEGSSDDEDDSEPIPPHGFKRRRGAHFPLEVVAEIFPKLSPETLCKSAEMTSSAPSSVLKLVPH